MAFFTLLLIAPALVWGEDARALVIRSLNEGDAVPLTGEQITSVTTRGSKREVVQVIRRKADRLRIDFTAPRAVGGQVVVDDGRTFRLYRPRLRIVEEGPSRLPGSKTQRLRQATQVQRGRLAVQEERQESVAGRSARVITVAPPGGRKARRLWIDSQSAVVLRVEETDASGGTVTTSFTRIDFARPPSDADFNLQLPPGTQVIPEGIGQPVPLARARAVAQEWGGLYQPAVLPPGFGLRGAFLTRFQRQPVVVLLYASGPQRLTLFQGARVAPPNRRQARNLTVQQRVVDGVTLTAVGPVPEAELKRTLDSVTR